MKNKKILKIIGILIIICAVIVGAIVVKENSEYTLKETKELVKKSLEIPDNIYLKTTYYDENGDERGRIENYIKGDYSYVKQEANGRVNYEIFTDYNAAKLITVMHTEEKIFIAENYPRQDVTEDTNEFIYSSKRNEQYAHLGIYQFLGREKVNGRKCIVVSLTDNNKEGLDVTNYYIDIETGYILKQEDIKDGNVKFTMINEYYEGVVTEDIVKYNEEKFADYEKVND